MQRETKASNKLNDWDDASLLEQDSYYDNLGSEATREYKKVVFRPAKRLDYYQNIRERISDRLVGSHMTNKSYEGSSHTRSVHSIKFEKIQVTLSKR